jgi:hypothetical protein
VETTDRSLEKGIGVTPNFLKATMKNKGKAGFDSEEHLINYAGQGIPFPDVTEADPQAGLKAAWNYDLRYTGGDDFLAPDWIYWLTDDKGQTRNLAGESNRIKFAFRVDVDPKPSLPGGDKIWYKDVIRLKEPFASKGLQQLMVRYTEFSRLKDLWVYVPGLRRITRVGTGHECDALGGFVFAQDDGNYWDGDTVRFAYEFLEAKDILVWTLYDFEKTKKLELYVHGAHATKPILERRKVWVIKQVPKFEGYCYGHRIWYYDPESHLYVWKEIFDKDGSLWKADVMFWGFVPNPYGGESFYNICGDNIDFKIWESAPWYHRVVKLNPGQPASDYTLDALRRAGR